MDNENQQHESEESKYPKPEPAPKVKKPTTEEYAFLKAKGALQLDRDKALDSLVKEATKINAPHISELCEALTEQLGGLEGIAAEIFMGLEAAKRANHAGVAFQRYINLIVQIIKTSTEHRRSAPDMEALTEQDLQVVVAEAAAYDLKDDQLADIARSRGFKIVREAG